MARRITYKAFGAFMIKNGYTEKEIKHLFATVKAMDKETRKWFIDWFEGKGFPNKQVEGITVEYLVKNYGLKPVNAFIVIDWLKTDPQAAKYFMLKIPTEVTISDKTANEMRAFLKDKNHKNDSEPENIAADIIE